MRENYSRHLTAFFRSVEDEKRLTASKNLSFRSIADSESIFQIPPEFDAKDYLSFLLHIDAELEHGLMLQYLYAAYSLGGSHIPEKDRDKVRSWQEIILGIAKEEMGHFVSVQNVLRLIGAPLNFGRQDYPWDTPFYPFPFKLEPLTLKSLAKYVYAESPEGWIDSNYPIAKEIKTVIDAAGQHGDPVGKLFKVILQLVKSEEIPDDVFQPNTYPFQAKFDEWGRGYTGGERGNTTAGHQSGAPDVLVVPISSRDDAYNALKEIAEQGEARTEVTKPKDLPSHFDRFLDVYKGLRKLLEKMPEGWQVSRNVAVNPYINSNENPDNSPSEGQTSEQERDRITNPEAVLWGHLSNTRYRMLLTFIIHSFLLEDGVNHTGPISPRGIIINSTFGEMYNIRSIANALIQLPLGGKTDKMAAPPFEIPYTLDLPMGEKNRWRLHKDLIIASHKIVDELRPTTTTRNLVYLNSLQEADNKLLSIINKITD